MENVERREGFKQVCVWEGTVVGPSEIENFEKFIKDALKTRVQYLEEMITFPDQENGENVEGTGGRNDIFFAVHEEDVAKFAVPRFQYHMRWVEDVLAKGNYKSEIYPERVRGYCEWKA